VQRGEIPADIPEVTADLDWRRIADVLVGCGFAASKREAERLVAGHAVKLDGKTVTDPRQPWTMDAAPVTITVGNRRFARILPNIGTAKRPDQLPSTDPPRQGTQ